MGSKVGLIGRDVKGDVKREAPDCLASIRKFGFYRSLNKLTNFFLFISPTSSSIFVSFNDFHRTRLSRNQQSSPFPYNHRHAPTFTDNHPQTRTSTQIVCLLPTQLIFETDHSVDSTVKRVLVRKSDKMLQKKSFDQTSTFSLLLTTG